MRCGTIEDETTVTIGNIPWQIQNDALHYMWEILLASSVMLYHAY